MARQGVLVEPYQRLNQEQIEKIHGASLEILNDPGIICFNRNATEIFGDNGAEVEAIETEGAPQWRLRIPQKLIEDAISSAPWAGMVCIIPAPAITAMCVFFFTGHEYTAARFPPIH